MTESRSDDNPTAEARRLARAGQWAAAEAVIARLIARGLVRETTAKSAAAHPGLARRYYALTAAGRSALAAEANRLKGAAALAEERLGPA